MPADRSCAGPGLVEAGARLSRCCHRATTRRRASRARSTSRCRSWIGSRLPGWIATARWSCTASTPSETSAHGPRGGSKSSGSGRCSTTSAASWTGWRTGCRSRARTPASHGPATGCGATCRPVRRPSGSGRSASGSGRPAGTAAWWSTSSGWCWGCCGSVSLAADPEARVETAMELGPSTSRPHAPIDEMREYFEEHDAREATITTSDGVLLGLLRLDAL